MNFNINFLDAFMIDNLASANQNSIITQQVATSNKSNKRHFSGSTSSLQNSGNNKSTQTHRYFKSFILLFSRR